MTAEERVIPGDVLGSIQPIVLVGGRSTRFGRDKLLEPVCGGRVLVQHPIDALRSVFGRRVLLVGACDPRVVALGDGTMPDDHPGVGPLGGVLSALRLARQDIFVLAGDMPSVDSSTIASIIRTAVSNPTTAAVLALTNDVQPCLGLYRASAMGLLEAALRSGRHALRAAIPDANRLLVPCSEHVARNVNFADDMTSGNP